VSRAAVIQEVRSAIADGDRPGALRLLRGLVEGEVDLSTLPTNIGDALVGTARGLEQYAKAGTALAGLSRVEARERVIQLLTHSGFRIAELAEIRQLLDSLQAEAREAEARAQGDDFPEGVSSRREGRRVGSVWLELKYIPDADSGKRTARTSIFGRCRPERCKELRLAADQVASPCATCAWTTSFRGWDSSGTISVG
jgi:hypothetical protein